MCLSGATCLSFGIFKLFFDEGTVSAELCELEDTKWIILIIKSFVLSVIGYEIEIEGYSSKI
jgi:hypothetical protein